MESIKTTPSGLELGGVFSWLGHEQSSAAIVNLQIPKTPRFQLHSHPKNCLALPLRLAQLSKTPSHLSQHQANTKPTTIHHDDVPIRCRP